MTPHEDTPLPLVEHLIELRSRLIVSLLAAALCALAAYPFSLSILEWLSKPAGRLVFLAPAEGFLIRIKVSLFSGLLIALPVVLTQAWLFTARALAPGLRRFLSRILPASYLMFLAGGSLALFLVIPRAIKFLLSFGAPGIEPMISVSSYLQFASWMALAFGGAFQIPLALVALNRAGAVKRETLASQRRMVYFLAFFAGAALTPDVFSQSVFAVSAILLFEGALLFMIRSP